MKRFLFILALCCTHIMTAQPKQSKIVVVDHSLIAVFNEVPYWIFPEGKATNLTQEDYLSIERILMTCFDEYNARAEKEFVLQQKKHPSYEMDEQDFVINWKHYKKQYFPVINDKGEKEIWVNFLCETDDDRWKKFIISVRDGGNCFLNIKINLSSKTYYNLMVNGVA